MADAPKSFHLSPEIHAYLVEQSNALDDAQRGLIEETQKLGGISIMQIAPEQGVFMQMLTQISGARRAVEVGTFTGYSALCLARGLPEEGTLLCLDVSEEWTEIGRRAWEKAGVAHKIELRIGPAADSLRGLPDSEQFDIAFIDADKTSYAVYYEEILKRMPAGGLILVDNVLWFGRVVDPQAQGEDTLALRAFNDKVAADERVEKVMLAVGDGLTIVRKR